MFEIPLGSREEQLAFSIYDEDWFKDDLIGMATFGVTELTESIEPGWFQFKDKGNRVIAEMSL